MIRKFIFVFLLIFIFNLSYANSNKDLLDGFDFKFKIYFGSDIKDRNDLSNDYFLKKIKTNIDYKINDNLTFSTSFFYLNKDKIRFDNTYFDYLINKNSTLSIGNLSAIFNMDFEKSENYLSTIFLMPNKAIRLLTKKKGLGFIYRNNIFENFTFNISYIGKNVDYTYYDNENVFSLKGFYFVKNDNKLFHIGLNSNFVYNKNERNFLKIQNNNILYNFYLKKSFLVGLDLATMLNSFTTETGMFLDRINTNDIDKYFNTYFFYTEITYMLTGEIKNYDVLSGSFKKVSVKRPINEKGFGAIEIALRYELTNAINNGNIYSMDLGRYKNFKFNINWLPNDYSKILIGYINTKALSNVINTKNNDIIKVEYKFWY